MKNRILYLFLLLVLSGIFLSTVFSQDLNYLEPDEKTTKARYDREDLNDAFNKGYEGGKVNEPNDFIYLGIKIELAIKEAYEAGKIEGLIEYYYNQGYLTGIKQPSRVPSDYQYADSWGEPIQLVESYKAGLQKGKNNYAEKNHLKEKFSEKEFQAIMNEIIYIGMSEAALIESYGNPDKINTTVTNSYILKQYVYNRAFRRTTYVYVENGIINGWQYY